MVLAGGEGLPSQRLLVPHVDPVQRPLGRTDGAATLSPSVRASEAFRQLQSEEPTGLCSPSAVTACGVFGKRSRRLHTNAAISPLLPPSNEKGDLCSPRLWPGLLRSLRKGPSRSPSLLTPASLCSPVLTTLRHPLSPPARERTAPAPPTRQPSVGRAGLLAFSCLLSQPPGEQRAGAGGGGVCVGGCSPEITFSFTVPRGHRPQAKPGQEVRLSFG